MKSTICHFCSIFLSITSLILFSQNLLSETEEKTQTNLLNNYAEKYRDIISNDKNGIASLKKGVEVDRIKDLVKKLEHELDIPKIKERYEKFIKAYYRILPAREYTQLRLNILYRTKDCIERGKNGGMIQRVCTIPKELAASITNLDDKISDIEKLNKSFDNILAIIFEGKASTIEEASKILKDEKLLSILNKNSKLPLLSIENLIKKLGYLEEPETEYKTSEKLWQIASQNMEDGIKQDYYEATDSAELLLRTILSTPIREEIKKLDYFDIKNISSRINIDEIRSELNGYRDELKNEIASLSLKLNVKISDKDLNARTDEMIEILYEDGFTSRMESEMIKDAFRKIDWNDPNLIVRINNNHLKVSADTLKRARKYYNDVYGITGIFNLSLETTTKIEKTIMVLALTVMPAGAVGGFTQEIITLGTRSILNRLVLSQVLKAGVMDGILARSLIWAGSRAVGGFFFGGAFLAMNSLWYGPSVYSNWERDILWSMITWYALGASYELTKSFVGSFYASQYTQLLSKIQQVIPSKVGSALAISENNLLSASSLLISEPLSFSSLQYLEGALYDDKAIPASLLSSYADSLLFCLCLRASGIIYKSAIEGAKINIEYLKEWLENGLKNISINNLPQMATVTVDGGKPQNIPAKSSQNTTKSKSYINVQFVKNPTTKGQGENLPEQIKDEIMLFEKEYGIPAKSIVKYVENGLKPFEANEILYLQNKYGVDGKNYISPNIIKLINEIIKVLYPARENRIWFEKESAATPSTLKKASTVLTDTSETGSALIERKEKIENNLFSSEKDKIERARAFEEALPVADMILEIYDSYFKVEETVVPISKDLTSIPSVKEINESTLPKLFTLWKYLLNEGAPLDPRNSHFDPVFFTEFATGLQRMSLRQQLALYRACIGDLSTIMEVKEYIKRSNAPYELMYYLNRYTDILKHLPRINTETFEKIDIEENEKEQREDVEVKKKSLG